MIAAAAGLFLYLYLSHVGVLPPLESWMVLIGWVVVFVFGALAAASLGSTIQAAVGKAWARFSDASAATSRRATPSRSTSRS